MFRRCDWEREGTKWHVVAGVVHCDGYEELEDSLSELIKQVLQLVQKDEALSKKQAQLLLIIDLDNWLELQFFVEPYCIFPRCVYFARRQFFD